VDDVTSVFRALGIVGGAQAPSAAEPLSLPRPDSRPGPQRPRRQRRDRRDVERLQRAWDLEPGYCKTVIVNAITRAAHTEEWRSWTTSEELERTAGELLYARVWNVQMPECAQL